MAVADTPPKPLLFGLDISMVPDAQAELEHYDHLEHHIYKWRYRQFDAAMVERSTHIGEWHLKQYLHNKHLHPAYERIAGFKRLSMLHEDVLLLLRMYAQAAKGAILEIGPYVGGSTLALADGVRAGGRKVPFFSIEIGGQNPTHEISTADIFSDLKRNVEREGLAPYVELINGNSRSPKVVELVKSKLGDNKIGLFMIDADGENQQDWMLYSTLLSDEAIVVLDDYVSPGNPAKAAQVKPFADERVVRGQLRQLGVFGFGTWFGQRMANKPDRFGTITSGAVGQDNTTAIGGASELVNPHFDHDLVVWDDSYSGRYQPVPYEKQFDDQWRLFLERAVGFHDHTGVETSDAFIDDRIEELTGVDGYIKRRKAGEVVTGPSGASDAASRAIGGTLLLEPKFAVDHFRGKRCLDVGCGAGRWTRVLIELGAKVKSLDVSEHGLASTRRYNDDVEKLDLFGLADRHDLHEAFDFVICWGVIMCTHDPKLAFELVARTVRPGGELYIMVYAPTYHASDFVTQNRKRYHRECKTFEEKLALAYRLSDDPRNTINQLDMLNTFYNWTIPDMVVLSWYRTTGFGEAVILNQREVHKAAWHVWGRKKLSDIDPGQHGFIDPKGTLLQR